jgi:O-antigen/teichoic acid export membrane protein
MATAATGSVFYGVLAIAAARVAVLVAYDLPNAALAVEPGGPAVWERGRDFRGLRPRCQVAKTVALARLSLPLGVVMMLIGLSASIPRYFVEHYWGPRSLGIFGALGYLGLVGTTAVAAIGQSATPRLAQCYAAGQRKPFAWLLLQLIGLGAGLGLAGVAVAYLAGQRLLGVFYGPEYARHNAILVWVMLAAGIGHVAAFGGYGLTAARYFKVQIPLFACVVAATAGACWWLVPGYGMLGAALSLLIAALVQLAGTAVVLAHAVRAPAGAYVGRVGPENP